MLLLLFVFPLVTSLTTKTLPRLLTNVDCGPYIHYVQTTRVYTYTPYVVALHRCLGKNNIGPLMECVPKTTQNIDILLDIEGTSIPGNMTMVNHTSCKESCVHNATSCNKYEIWEESTCSCLCNQHTPPADCISPFYWDQTVCSCRCPRTAASYKCDTLKEFSKTACGCMCKSKWARKCKRVNKYLNSTNCGCDFQLTTGAVEQEKCLNERGKIILIIVAVFEAIAILALFYLYNQYFDLFKRYCCSRNSKIMKFNDGGNNNCASDKISIDTPTMAIQHIIGNSPSTLEKTQNNLNEKKLTDENHQPFLFSDSLSRNNKYRYEMSNVVPIFYKDDEKSYLTRKNTNSSVSYNDVDDESDNTFTLSDSLASVTQV